MSPAVPHRRTGNLQTAQKAGSDDCSRFDRLCRPRSLRQRNANRTSAVRDGQRPKCLPQATRLL